MECVYALALQKSVNTAREIHLFPFSTSGSGDCRVFKSNVPSQGRGRVFTRGTTSFCQFFAKQASAAGKYRPAR